MAKIPQVSRSIQEPNLQSGTISQTQFAGDDSVSKALTFASKATEQYAVNEKKQFDLARLTEARNILDVRETQLSSDEKTGWQNKLGQNAVLFKDEDGKDFMSHYSDRFQSEIADTEKQLQLTPDQRKIFSDYAQQKAVSFNDQLRKHQLRQGKEYKVSVFTSAAEIAAKKAQGQFTDTNEMDKSIEQMKSDYIALGAELGWSEAEKMNKISDAENGVHGNNLTVILEAGDFNVADAYVKKYGNNMSQLQKLGAETKIRKLRDDYAAAQIISIESEAMSNGSNPAFNSNNTELIRTTAKIDPSEYGRLNYNDPRLDSLAVVTAKDLKMEWAVPLVTALRVAGEKSNNGQTSSAGAKGVYQFTDIAIKEVERLTGKKIDPTNPEESTWAAYKFVEYISKRYETKDPAIIASYYNGGGNHIPLMKAGGVDAIINKENRNYVKRITGFNFEEYASRPVAKDGLNLDISQRTPKNQAKILANREKLKKQAKQAENEKQELAYNNAARMMWSGKATFEQIKASPEVVGYLDNKQLTALNALGKAIKSNDSSDLVASIYRNPTKLKGMPQSEIEVIISLASESDKKEISKMYATANGRSLQDLKDIQKDKDSSKPKSILTNQKVFSVIDDYAPILGFTTKSKNGKVQQTDKDSAMFIAIKDDLYASATIADNRMFSQTGKYMTEFQMRNYLKRQLDRNKNIGSDRGGTKEVSIYSAETKKDNVNERTNQDIMKMALAEGRNYKKVDEIPESLYWKYYYRAWRRP